MMRVMIDRRFLGSGRHLVHALAEDLADRCRTDGVVDLSRTVVMLPTSRSLRCLERQLLHETDGELLTPPILLTPSSLLDRIIVPRRSIAGPLASDMAWLGAIRALSQEQRQVLLGHTDPLSIAESHALGERLAGVTRDLAAALHTPQDVALCCEAHGVPVDAPRWEIISELHRGMLDHLAAMGLDDRDTAHHLAIEDGRLHLHGIEQVTTVSADLPPRLRRVLNTMSERGIRVENIVHGDAGDLEDVFLADGTVDVDAWCERDIDIDHVDVAPQVEDQIAVAFEYMAAMGEGTPDGLAASAVCLVVPDETLKGPLRGAALVEGVPLECFENEPLDRSQVGTLIMLLRGVAELQSAATLGSLTRHPDVTAWLLRAGEEAPVTTWDDM